MLQPIMGPTAVNADTGETLTSSTSALNHAEYREDTAIRRQYHDLIAAGINPILAGNLGGSSSAAAVKYVDSAATTSIANSAEKNATANLIKALTGILNSASNFKQ